MTARDGENDVFRYDDAGNLDDVAVSHVDIFRLEYMDQNRVWLCCYKPDGSRVSFWLSARGKITGLHMWD